MNPRWSLTLIAVAFCALCVVLILTLIHVDNAVQDMGNRIEELQPAIQAASVAAQHLSSTLDKIDAASNVQLKDFAATQRSIRKLIVLTDKNLNDPYSGALPQLRVSLANISGTLDQLKPTLSNLSSGSAALDTDLRSPQIKIALDNVAAAAANTNKMTQEGAATLADVQEGVHYEVKQLEKPVNKMEAALKFVAGLAGNFFHL